MYIPTYYLTKQRKGVSKIEASRPKVDCKQQNTIDSTTKNVPNFTRTYNIIFVEKRLTYCQGNWKVFIMTQKRKRLLTTHLDMLNSCLNFELILDSHCDFMNFWRKIRLLWEFGIWQFLKYKFTEVRHFFLASRFLDYVSTSTFLKPDIQILFDLRKEKWCFLKRDFPVQWKI